MNEPSRGSQPPDVAEKSPETVNSAATPVQEPPTVTFQPPLAPEQRDPAWPKIAGYEILGELGHGAMGVVYKARHLGLKRLVALKMVLSGGRARPEELARFRGEAEAVARLKHPHIVQIHDIGEHDGQPYFSLEFVDGGTLAKKLHGDPQPPRHAAELIETLARAMHVAHEHGIVHRDLKPGNILLSPLPTGGEGPGVRGFGAFGTPKVADFGLAKQLDADQGQTQTGAIMGTPAYMAPEQAAGKTKDVGPLCDVYALGVILYEMLTGRQPFKGESIADTLDQVRTQEPVPPTRLQPKVPRDLETICLKCLAKSAAGRYATVLALAEDLRRFLAGEPILARPVGQVERFGRWCRRNPVIARLSAAVVLALIAGTAVAWYLAVDAMAEKGRADANAAKSDVEREKAETLALSIQFEHYSSKAENRPDLAMVGMATLLSKAGTLKDQSLANSLRLHIGACSAQAVRLNAIYAHQSFVHAVALSSDGKMALTGSWDNTAQLWETATGNPIGPKLQHSGVVVAVALSADGKTALTGSGDKSGRLWQTANGMPIGPPLMHQGEVRTVALSANGKTALTGSNDKTARLWETGTGKPIGPPLQHQDDVTFVALSADGKTALTTGRGDARLWETPTGKPIGAPLQHLAQYHVLALSPDGKSVLTATSDHVVQLRETLTTKPTGAPLQVEWHTGPTSGALSVDGKTIATATRDMPARVWQTATSKPIGLPLLHLDDIIAVALSADGKTILTGSNDKTAKVWQIPTGNLINLIYWPPLQHQDEILSAVLSADGRIALTGSHDKAARLWEVASGKPIGPPLQHLATVRAVALSTDGKTSLTGSDDGTARLWETATGKPIGPPLQHLEQVRAVALSADGKTALTASYDGTAQLWESATGKPIGPPLKHHHSLIFAVALSGDGKTVLTGSHDRTARLWETATGMPIGPPLNHQSQVTTVALSADGKIALTGSDDKTARLWQTANGNPIEPPLQHQGVVDAVALSADGTTALTVSSGEARLWETATRKQLGLPLQTPPVFPVALSADGKFVLALGAKTEWLWKVPQPIRGDPERIKLWTQVITGLEVDELTTVRVLDAATWRQRRQRLQELGGPPVSD